MLELNFVTDILEWMNQKTLVLNPEFQRRYVWSIQAKSYFIDTILRGRPSPNIYIRTIIDVKTKKSYREVVDGQQRLRTICEYSEDKFTLGSRAEEYQGLRYQGLSEDLQAQFLGYQIGVVQLFNADNEEVIDIFRRINSYGLPVNPQELRHAKYNGDFRWSVESASEKWAVLWEKYKVVSLQNRLRMADDELVAQLFGIIIQGVTDGGQPKIEKLYNTYDKDFPEDSIKKVDSVLEYILKNFADVMETSLARSPQFLMMFAAIAHALLGIPKGDVELDKKTVMPEKDPRALTDIAMAKTNLKMLADVLDSDPREVPERFQPFKAASGGTTQRIAGRRIRFPMLFKALMPEQV